MAATRRSLVVVLVALAAIIALAWPRSANASEALNAAKLKEADVIYGALVATTHAAANATGNLSFWEQAVDAANVSDSPISVLLDLMMATDWAYEALTVWVERYSNVDIEAAYADAAALYANQTSL